MDMRFAPVVVNGGRRFKGNAYRVEGEYISRFGYAGSGACPLQITQKVKVWDPVTNATYYVNFKYVESREVSECEFKSNFAKYCEFVVTGTMNWCREVSSGKSEDEIVRFAYNVVRKHNPDALPIFEAKYGFKEDVAGTVKSTIDWAMGLGYRKDKALRIALRALSKKGITQKDGFGDIYAKGLASRGLSEYAA